MAEDTKPLADLQAAYGRLVNATDGRPDPLSTLEKTIERIKSLGTVATIPEPLKRIQAGALPPFTAVYIEKGRQEGEGEVIVLSDSDAGRGRDQDSLGVMPWPKRRMDAREQDFRASAVWSRLLDELARAAGGRVVVTTCSGVGWTHRAVGDN